MRSTLRKTQINSNNESQLQNYQPRHVRRLEVVDDYIRNFLTKHGMSKTLNSFQKEWYECVKGKEDVPDAEIENEVLKDQIEQLRDQLEKAVVLSEKAKATYDKLLK
jgi:sperm-associated antigen 16 protein